MSLDNTPKTKKSQEKAIAANSSLSSSKESEDTASSDGNKLELVSLNGRDDIQKDIPIGKDEFAISAPGLGEHFIGEQYKIAKQINKMIGITPKNYPRLEIKCEINGQQLIFLKRKNFSYTIWALKNSDKVLLAKAMRWNLRTDVSKEIRKNTLQIQPGELAISPKGLKNNFIGRPHIIANLIKEKIGVDPETYTDSKIFRKINGQRFTFTRRMNAMCLVWTLKSKNIDSLAKAMGLKHRSRTLDVQHDEFAISFRCIKEHFVVSKRQINKIKEKIGIDFSKSEITREINGELFVFTRRMNGPWTVLALKNSDKERFAKVVNLEIKTEGQKNLRDNTPQTLLDEFMISATGLREHFTGATQKIAKQINIILDEKLQDYSESEITSEINRVRFTFMRRTNGSCIVWTLKNSDKERFSKAVDLEIRTKKQKQVRKKTLQIQLDEFPISGPSFKKHFIGASHQVLKKVKENINANPSTYYKFEISREIKGEVFIFTRRKNGSSIVWALNISDKDRIAKALNLEIRTEKQIDIRRNAPQIKLDEFAISVNSIRENFIGAPRKMTKQIAGKIGTDPEIYLESEIHCKINDEQFVFFRRINNTHLIWALNTADKKRLAAALGWQLRSTSLPSTGIYELATYLEELDSAGESV